ncbi:AraC family transcriptional regulator [Saccharopolyspora cebuensis]|uniref:Helix-turn-helix transcriptional regulator n=1 Tax=Saccharopolyspora cebuensis TaxID=418759 RepID=A0ABV4CSS4_9PSEU
MTRSVNGSTGVDTEPTGGKMAHTEPISAIWYDSVERAVQQMRDDLALPRDLSDHARAGLFSPFHFHRVFRNVTATTPGRFLAALRIAEAQRLLIRSPLRVTDIAPQVGYSSLSTFTTQFTRLVGLPPQRFRLLATELGDQPLTDLVDRAATRPPVDGVRVLVDGAEEGMLFVGLFRHGIPQGAPASCAARRGPGLVRLPRPNDGQYHALAVCFTPNVRVSDSLDYQYDCRAVAAEPITLPMASPGTTFRLTLRSPRPTDPPIVLAMALLR